MDVITKTETLKSTCEALRKCAYVAIDTEFMRDKTYWSKLCLVQLAGEGVEAMNEVLLSLPSPPAAAGPAPAAPCVSCGCGGGGDARGMTRGETRGCGEALGGVGRKTTGSVFRCS